MLLTQKTKPSSNYSFYHLDISILMGVLLLHFYTVNLLPSPLFHLSSRPMFSYEARAFGFFFVFVCTVPVSFVGKINLSSLDCFLTL